MTYNPDQSLLSSCIGSLVGQVSTVLVFDNCSEDVAGPREAVLAFREGGADVRLVENRCNAGMAVALNSIAAMAEHAGATSVIFLDQDSIASPNLISELSVLLCDDVALSCPIVLDRNVEVVEYDHHLVFDVKRPITSGSMVDLRAWRAVGGYDERLFVDWVDNEFCNNLRAHGYRMVRTHAASISHAMGNAEYAWRGPGRDYAGNRRARRGYYRSNYPSWRWEDRARSEAITIRKYRWMSIGLEEIGLFVKGVLGRIILIEPRKRECLAAAMRGAARGLAAGRDGARS